jgi:hypothetical protein
MFKELFGKSQSFIIYSEKLNQIQRNEVLKMTIKEFVDATSRDQQRFY